MSFTRHDPFRISSPVVNFKSPCKAFFWHFFDNADRTSYKLLWYLIDWSNLVAFLRNERSTPSCFIECVSNGQQKSVGDSWIRRTTLDVCYECSCSESAAAECYQIQCMPCDGVTVTVPGRCCPRCDPGEYKGGVKAGVRGSWCLCLLIKDKAPDVSWGYGKRYM